MNPTTAFAALGTAAGAAIGTLVAPGPGTAVGAAVGTAVGFVVGLAQQLYQHILSWAVNTESERDDRLRAQRLCHSENYWRNYYEYDRDQPGLATTATTAADLNSDMQ